MPAVSESIHRVYGAFAILILLAACALFALILIFFGIVAQHRQEFGPRRCGTGGTKGALFVIRLQTYK